MPSLPSQGTGWKRHVGTTMATTPRGVPMRILDSGPDAPLDETSNRLWPGIIAATIAFGLIVVALAYLT